MCVGVNYLGRNAEYKDAADRPKYPSLFLGFLTSFVAHEQPLMRPPESIQFDYEGELAVIIGRRGRRIAPETALDTRRRVHGLQRRDRARLVSSRKIQRHRRQELRALRGASAPSS